MTRCNGCAADFKRIAGIACVDETFHRIPLWVARTGFTGSGRPIEHPCRGRPFGTRRRRRRTRPSGDRTHASVFDFHANRSHNHSTLGKGE